MMTSRKFYIGEGRRRAVSPRDKTQPVASAALPPAVSPRDNLKIMTPVRAQPPLASRVDVPGLFSAVVEHCPPGGNRYYSTSAPGVVTQDLEAAANGVIALRAHGRAEFFSLSQWRPVAVTAAGAVKHYHVSGIYHFQALASPLAPRWASMKNGTYLDMKRGKTFTAPDLWEFFFGKGDRLVFYTCIEQPGNPMWGRLFVVAAPTP